MKCYVLSVRFYTGGNYICNYEKLKEESCYEYNYSKVFLNLDVAIKESVEVISKMSNEIAEATPDVNQKLHDMFVEVLSQFSTPWFKDGNLEVYSYLDGYYEGTEIRFFESEID